MFFCRLRSRSPYFGPLSQLSCAGQVPNVPAEGTLKLPLFVNHWYPWKPTPACLPVMCAIESQLGLELREFVPEWSSSPYGVIGNPPRNVMIGLTVQPPTTASTTLFMSFPNRFPCPIGNS